MRFYEGRRREHGARVVLCLRWSIMRGFLVFHQMSLFYDFVCNLNCWYLLVKEGEFFWSIRKKTNAVGIRCHSIKKTQNNRQIFAELNKRNERSSSLMGVFIVFAQWTNISKTSIHSGKATNSPAAPEAASSLQRQAEDISQKFSSGSLCLIMTGKLL